MNAAKKLESQKERHSNEDVDVQHCVSLLQGSLKKKAGDVLASIEGVDMAQFGSSKLCVEV